MPVVSDRPGPVAVREELKRRHWSIHRLARELKRSPSTVCRWLSGARSPSKSGMRLLKDLLGIDPGLWV